MIYFDNAATTKISPEVLDAMLPYLKDNYGNASSIYTLGRDSKKALDEAKDRVAKAINAKSNEIFFTSGGSESDNWAIKGIAYANKEKGNHIITTQFEHHAVLHTCQYLEKNGFEVTYLPVNENGVVNPEDVRNAITDKTILISVMFANNEIGTIQPIEEIGKIAKEKGIYFHTDAVQATGNIPIDVEKMDIDLLSLSAHKFHGPKGIGVLFIRNNVCLAPLIHGGGQERGKRAGTENVAGIAGLGKAIELATSNIEEKNKKVLELRNNLLDKILEIPLTRLNGDRDQRLPGNINVSFQYVEGESILLMLDMAGIEASSGSACTSGSLDPSHVLLAIGLPHEIAHGSLRITLNEDNTKEETEKLISILPNIIKKLRDMSPTYDKYIKEGNKNV